MSMAVHKSCCWSPRILQCVVYYVLRAALAKANVYPPEAYSHSRPLAQPEHDLKAAYQ